MQRVFQHTIVLQSRRQEDSLRLKIKDGLRESVYDRRAGLIPREGSPVKITTPNTDSTVQHPAIDLVRVHYGGK